jgi:acetolactate synthase-1/2/3 large subunit
LFADDYLEGDTAVALALLLDAVERTGPDENRIAARRDRIAARRDAGREKLSAVEAAAAADPAPNAIALCRALADEMPADTIYVDETISHAPVVQRHLARTHPQSYFRASGGLGQGLGLALGIKLAAPQRPVVLAIGDGSLLYNPIVQGLGAALRHRLPILIVVFDNAGYETMRLGHIKYFPGGAAAANRYFVAGDIDGPAFERLGEIYGFKGWRVESADRLRPAIREARAELAAGRSAILSIALPKP